MSSKGYACVIWFTSRLSTPPSHNPRLQASVYRCVTNTNEFNKSQINTRLLTTAEVAEVCRTAPATVRYWRHTGYGPKGLKVGRRVLYPAASVEAWLDDLRVAEASR